MKCIIESGLDSLLFVGEGVGNGIAFSSEAGTNVLRLTVSSLGYKAHYIELRKDDYEDVISETEVKSVYDYINTNSIKKVVCLGKGTASALFPSIAKGQTISSLVESAMITPTEADTKVGVVFHPFAVLNNKDPDAYNDWSDQLNRLLTNKSDVEVVVNKINNEDEFIDLLQYLSSTSTKLGLDYETNAEDPFSVNFYVTMIGLSVLINKTKAVAWHWHNPKVIPPRVAQALLEFYVKNSNRLWTYNVSFEMRVTWHILGKYIKMQDAMVLATCMAKRGSLKNVIRSEFGAMMWESVVHDFKEKSSQLFALTKKVPEIYDACKNGDLETLKSLESSQGIISWMLEEYSEEEIIESISHIPYEWGSVPKDLLGTYCARDAGYTVILAEKYYTQDISLAYDVCIRHPWLAVKFEVNGVSWNDKEANLLNDNLFTEKLDLLYKLIMDGDLTPESKMEATAVYHKELPYSVITYTEKTRKEKIRQVTSLSDKLDDLKCYFNPGSNTKESRSKFWNIYATNEIQLATVLLLFLEDIELSGKLDELHLAVGDKSFLYQNKPDVVMEKLVELSATKLPIVSYIRSSLARSTNLLDENMGRFASEVIKLQYRVHKTFLGLDINDNKTWSKEWQMIFNIFLYKKYDKVQGNNINGTNGRSSVSEVVGSLHGKPMRGHSYYEGANIRLNMIMNTRFNSLAAATNRWTSGWHTIPAGSPARKILGVANKRSIWVHADYSQAELVVLAYLSQDQGMIQSFLDGKDMHKFVASKVYQKNYDDVTSEERRSAKAVGFGIIYGKSVENTAIEVTNGDVERAQALFDTFFGTFPGIKIWMQQRREELDKYGYVTNMFGGRLEVDVTAPGNGRYRVAINAPIQCAANLIAGTSIFEFTEWCEQNNIPTSPIGFTHDALDDVLDDVDNMFEYLDGLVYKLQDQVYERLGVPMRIDYEIGVDSFNQCHYKVLSREEKHIKIELKGTENAVNSLINTMKLSNTFSITETIDTKSETVSNSYEELFTVGKALKDEWGKTVTTKSTEISILRN